MVRSLGDKWLCFAQKGSETTLKLSALGGGLCSSFTPALEDSHGYLFIPDGSGPKAGPVSVTHRDERLLRKNILFQKKRFEPKFRFVKDFLGHMARVAFHNDRITVVVSFALADDR
jgi:hypothetical protein